MRAFGSSSSLFTASNLLLFLASLAQNVAADDDYSCSVKHVVVEMSSQTPAVAALDVKPSTVSEIGSTTSVSVARTTPKPSAKASQPPKASKTTIYASASTAHQNTTATFVPITPPDVDCSNLENVVPKKNVSLSYSEIKEKASNETTTLSETASSSGSIDMTFVMNNPAVVLEYIDTIASVDCSADSVTVQFDGSEAFEIALESWLEDENFIIITNNMGDCDAEFERGFFLVDGISSNKEDQSITCQAAKQEIPSLAESCEMSFSSIPAATLRKRLTLDPSVSHTFSVGLPEDTVLFSEEPWVTIKADQAEFSSTVTFSGYLKYNFWGFKLEQLYFDLDTQFSADVGLSAEVAAAWSKSIAYDPEALSYNFVDVPGIVSLGPGIGFGVGVDIATSAGVAVQAGAGISIPAGNVHLDVVDSSQNSATGWEPQYTSYANITESVEVGLNASTSVTVQLTFKLLGGLVDLSSGLTATPGFNNKFTLDAAQSVTMVNNVTTVNLYDSPKDCGISFKSDFVFDLDAFATQWWSDNLYHVEIPITDTCYQWENTTTTSDVRKN